MLQTNVDEWNRGLAHSEHACNVVDGFGNRECVVCMCITAFLRSRLHNMRLCALSSAKIL